MVERAVEPEFRGARLRLVEDLRAKGIRDLAVLRALGSDSHQLRAIVHWQSTLVTVVALLAGVPIGIIVGRSIVDLLTDALGIVPGADVPPLFILLVVVELLVPVVIYALAPRRAGALLGAARRWLEKNNRVITIFVFGVFGTLMLVRGFTALLG